MVENRKGPMIKPPPRVEKGGSKHASQWVRRRKTHKCTLVDVHFPKCGLERPLTEEQFKEFKEYVLEDLERILGRMYGAPGPCRLQEELQGAPLAVGGRQGPLVMMAGGQRCELVGVTYDYCVVNGETAWCQCEHYLCPDGSEYTVCTEVQAES